MGLLLVLGYLILVRPEGLEPPDLLVRSQALQRRRRAGARAGDATQVANYKPLLNLPNLPNLRINHLYLCNL